MAPKRDACTYCGVQTVQSRTCAGANRGIGFATAQQLVDQGREVIVACRNEKKGAAAPPTNEGRRKAAEQRPLCRCCACRRRNCLLMYLSPAACSHR